jgi:hypothetical protein
MEVVMRRTLSLALVALIPALGLGCSSPTDPEVLTIRGGTSFGFCAPTAYCETTVQITPGSAAFTKKSRSLGEVQASATLARGVWERLVDAVDEEQLRALPAVVGCPDCADGGAEWVEVTTEGWTHRVTFEFGSAPESIEKLVIEVRRIREDIEDVAPAR